MIAWIDVETSGTDPKVHSLLEVALVLTDDDLNVLQSRTVVICPPEPIVFSKEHADIEAMHVTSGLLRDVYEKGVPIRWAEQSLIQALESVGVVATKQAVEVGLTEGGPPMGGISLWLDRMFLQQYMPTFLKKLHYRNVDLTTVREFAKRWRPDLVEREPKAGSAHAAHRGEADLMQTLELARFYRRELFRPSLASLPVPELGHGLTTCPVCGVTVRVDSVNADPPRRVGYHIHGGVAGMNLDAWCKGSRQPVSG